MPILSKIVVLVYYAGFQVNTHTYAKLLTSNKYNRSSRVSESHGSGDLPITIGERSHLGAGNDLLALLI